MLVYMYYSISGFSQTWTRPEDAANHIGDTVNLVGLISYINQVIDGKGTRLLISIKGKDYTPSLLLEVLDSDRQNFKKDFESTYINQYVHVKGKVKIYKGNPKIILSNQNQISIAREDIRPID